MKKPRTIKTRIVLGFSCFAVFIALLFSFFNFIFAYTVEDAFFDRLVKEEARYINDYHAQNNAFPSPRQSFFSIHQSANTLPQDIRNQYIAQPRGTEFAGADQRHYHLLRQSGDPEYILLAEISEILVIRPIRNYILIFLAITTLLMLVLAGGFGYWTATRTTRPLTRLADEISNSQPDTLPRHFKDKYPNNEIGVVASSLEQAMQRIAAFIEREQNFTRDSSHELRTPIAVIKGSVELLKEKKLEPDIQGLVERIERACTGMEQTVETLLMLARESRQTQRNEKTRVLPLVEQTVLNCHYLLGNKPVSVDIDIKPNTELNLAPSVLQIIVSNLISNAFQYTSEGEVRVTASTSQLQVSDTGTGIDESIKSEVCENLVKGAESKGFGIGLSIVKRLCEKYNLALHIHSDQTGTSISVDIPTD